ncbi:nuclease-related domain-containing protein [Neobacillus niacini]|uniref:nuclease-related domain-containing protein n=1 Tax=Neobacillus niacini TaxID=86668 RepID=UPI0007AC2A91|nr:nuclease-related domain-containing protein [Neobacillus niacini]MEC1522277.1 nuclease-related domain-containing protein [Neobacillus niacini]
MFLKSRTESDLLKLLGFLNNRMSLTEDDLKQYLYLKKGYEGELAFDRLTAATLNSDVYILNDIMLEINHSKFQIDSSLIIQDTIFPCEIKNFEGNYFYNDGEFHFSGSKSLITNPLHQVKRAETLLQQYLKKNGFHFRIVPYLVFINPKFFLYQAPQNDSIIFPPQLSSFMEKLNSKPPNLNGMQRKLADKMIADHIIESPYPKLPPYEYHSLLKGFTCAICNSFQIACGERKVTCKDCGFEEEVESAVVRSVEELILLFPSLKITTNIIHDWCGVVESRKTIRKFLTKNYKLMGHGKYSYFEVLLKE